MAHYRYERVPIGRARFQEGGATDDQQQQQPVDYTEGIEQVVTQNPQLYGPLAPQFTPQDLLYMRATAPLREAA